MNLACFSIDVYLFLIATESLYIWSIIRPVNVISSLFFFMYAGFIMELKIFIMIQSNLLGGY